MLSTPHLDEMDENYKRLQYNRYADDFLISITGSKQDAENIKEQGKDISKRQAKSHNVGGENSRTHSSEKVRYLGYDIRISRSPGHKADEKKVCNGCGMESAVIYAERKMDCETARIRCV